MTKKQYNIFIEEKIVNRAKKLSKKYGSKLSPFIEELLLKWCEDEEAKWEQVS